MAQKIRIYLDTSDYALLANKHSSDHEKVFQFLLEQVDRAEIEIAHSFFVISELIREFDSRGFESRLARARVVMSLTRGVSFRFPPLSESSTCPIGHYFPPISLSDAFSPAALEKKIKTEIDTKLKDVGVPRSKRKALTSRASLRAQVAQLGDELASALVEHSGSPESMQFLKTNVFRDLYLGRITQKEAEEKFHKMFVDIELLVKLMATANAHISVKNIVESAFTHIDNLTTRIRDICIEAESLLSEAKDNYRDTKKRFPTAKATIENARGAKRMAEENFKKILDGLLIPLDLPPTVFPSAVLRAYLKANIRSNRVRERSTVMDMWHAIYLPHCDLWRGDLRFSRLLIGESVPCSTKIVSSFLDLPDRINHLKSLRASQA